VILSAIAEKLKRRSQDNFKCRHLGPDPLLGQDAGALPPRRGSPVKTLVWRMVSVELKLFHRREFRVHHRMVSFTHTSTHVR
jgi:hypothetical protein